LVIGFFVELFFSHTAFVKESRKKKLKKIEIREKIGLRSSHGKETGSIE